MPAPQPHSAPATSNTTALPSPRPPPARPVRMTNPGVNPSAPASLPPRRTAASFPPPPPRVRPSAPLPSLFPAGRLEYGREPLAAAPPRPVLPPKDAAPSISMPAFGRFGHEGGSQMLEPRGLAIKAAPTPAATSPPPPAAKRTHLKLLTGGFWTASQARWRSLLGSAAKLHPALPEALDQAAGERLGVRNNRPAASCPLQTS
jgi:hypothetical protein